MKLETTIKPRKDGSVNVEIEGQKYAFVADESGALVCEVEDEKHVVFLLANSNFMPADEADFEAAELLTANAGNDDDDDEDPDEDAPDMNAAPIEEPASAVSAPAPAKGGRPRKAK